MESTGLGKTLFRMLVREGLPVKDLLSTGGDLDKVTRASPVAVRMEYTLQKYQISMAVILKVNLYNKSWNK